MPQVGTHRINEESGKTQVWAGDAYGWQTPESYNANRDKIAASRPWWWHLTPEGLGNQARFMREQERQLNQRVGYNGPLTIGGVPLPLQEVDGRVVAGNSTPAITQATYGATFGVAKNLARLDASLTQRANNAVSGGSFTDAVDESEVPAMARLNELDEAVRDAPGLEQTYDRPPNAAVFENLGGEVSTTFAGTAAGGALVPASAFTAGAFGRLAPWMQKALRWTSGIGTESGISTIGTADQNLEGNIANATTPNGPFAVNSKDDILSATVKSLLPNMGMEIALGGAFDVGGRAAGKGFSAASNGYKALYPNISRSIYQRRLRSLRSDARNWMADQGLQIQPDPDAPFWDFPTETLPESPAGLDESTAAVSDGTTTTADAGTDGTAATGGVSDPWGVGKEGPTPETAPTTKPAQPKTMAEVDEQLLAEPIQDPWAPNAIEAENVKIGLDELDDEQLKALDGDGPVLDQLESALEAKPSVEEVAPISEGVAAVPSSALASPTVPYRDQWAQLETATLIGLANPETSPRLFREVERISGKSYAEFNRQDVLDGLAALEAEGFTLLPSRMGDGVMRVEDIEVDPQRFQFKEGVNAQGEQAGNSLSGVERWNPDAEGEIAVWTDPADGKTYVVNGHNRLAKARELGIPTVRTKELLAATDSQARSLGAIENIASGGGTEFDAAKFIREAGITTPEQLEAAGIPLNSGTGTSGLALSRLPDTLFQQAVNGELPLGRALKLGGSDLDPETMIRVAQMGEARNMSERGFQELVDMAGTAPKVESDQMGLFGAEMVDTMTIKAELAGKVKADLVSNKNLMAKVSKKQAQQQLSEVGTEVNVDAAQVRRQLVAGLVDEFDAEKYMTGTPISQLLNEGTEQIANGAKRNVIAKRIVQQLSTAAEEAPPAPKVADSAVTDGLNKGQIARLEAMSPEELAAEKARLKKMLLGDKARANREATIEAQRVVEEQALEFISNPDAYPEGTEPVLPTRSEFDTPRRELARDKYARVALEWIDSQPEAPMTGAERDQLKRKIIKRAIDNGEVRPSQSPLPELPEAPKNLDDPTQLVQDEIRLANEFDRQQQVNDFLAEQSRRETTGYDDMPLEEQKANGMLDGWDEPADSAVTTATFEMPAEVARSAPRFGSVRLKFENDLDKAAYIIRDKTKKSKGEPRIKKALQEQGFNVAEVQRLGNDIKNMIQDAVEAETGSRRAPQGLDIEIEVPSSTRDGVDFSVPKEEIFGWVDGFAPEYRMKRSELMKSLDEVIERVSGPNWKNTNEYLVGDKLMDLSKSGHNVTGMKPVGGWYDSAKDLIVITNLMGRRGDDLMSTAYHEAWHRVQYRLLSESDMNILESAWGRAKVEALTDPWPRSYLEKQAIAFENYAEIRSKAGITEIESLGDALTIKALEDLDLEFPLEDGRLWKDSFRGKAIRVLGRLFHQMWEVVDRINNLRKGNGYRTVYDMFEDAYQGRLNNKRMDVIADTMAAELLESRYKEGLSIEGISENGEFGRTLRRMERLNEWRKKPKMFSVIDAQIADLKKTALNGGC